MERGRRSSANRATKDFAWRRQARSNARGVSSRSLRERDRWAKAPIACADLVTTKRAFETPQRLCARCARKARREGNVRMAKVPSACAHRATKDDASDRVLERPRDEPPTRRAPERFATRVIHTPRRFRVKKECARCSVTGSNR